MELIFPFVNKLSIFHSIYHVYGGLPAAAGPRIPLNIFVHDAILQLHAHRPPIPKDTITQE